MGKILRFLTISLVCAFIAADSDHAEEKEKEVSWPNFFLTETGDKVFQSGHHDRDGSDDFESLHRGPCQESLETVRLGAEIHPAINGQHYPRNGAW